MPCGATQDRWVMVDRSDRMWSTGEGNGKPLQYSCLENPMNSMKRQNDRILKEELPRSVGAQCATGDQWRNNSRKNEGMEPKQKQYPAVDVTGDRSKVQCCIPPPERPIPAVRQPALVWPYARSAPWNTVSFCLIRPTLTTGIAPRR